MSTPPTSSFDPKLANKVHDLSERATCWPFFHKWAKWEQYDWRGISYGPVFCKDAAREVSYRRQRRKCDVCGKEQDELVRVG